LISTINEIESIGHTPDGRGKIKTLDSLKALWNEWALYTKQANPALGHDIEEYQEHVDKINLLIQQMESNSSTTIPGFLQTLGKTDTISKRKISKHLRHLQIAFAKAVKNPESESELEVAEQFFNMATKLFITKRPRNYLYVAYPKSSKDFNKSMAKIIAREIDAIPIQIDKVKTKDVQINQHEMLLRAQAMVQKQHKLEAIGGIESSHPNWPQEWRDREVRKLKLQLPKNPDAEATIKALHGDKRRYAQLFGISDPKLFAGESILVVDDNVAHQGTMEMLHALINNQKPARLDMYTPLLLPI